MTRYLETGYRAARRVVVAVVGGTLVLLGLALLVLPGPALLVLPIGLAVLGLEFAWARRWLQRVREFGPRRRREPERESPPGPNETQS